MKQNRIPARGESVTPSRPPSPICALLSSAIQEQQAGRLENAKVLCLKILSIDVHHADALNLLGLVLYRSGEYQAALKMISRAIAIRTAEPMYHLNLGSVLLAAGRSEDALAAWNKAVLLDKRLIGGWRNLGNRYFAKRDFDNAKRCFERVLHLDSDSWDAFNGLGQILQQRHESKEAQRCFERALDIRPGDVSVSIKLSNLFLETGNAEEAQACLEQALARNPNCASLHSNLGVIMRHKNQLEQARLAFARAVSIDPSYASAHHNLGNVLLEQQKAEEALPFFERALALDPNAVHYCGLGQVYLELGEVEKARSLFQKSLALSPNYVAANHNLGKALMEEGKLQEAKDCYERALSLDPDCAQAKFGLSAVRLAEGDFRSGWASYEARWQAMGGEPRLQLDTFPLWGGEKLTEGRVLLWGEQGVGDEVMFASMIPDALKTGSRILLDCEPRLAPLFRRSFPQIEVISTKEKKSDPMEETSVAAHLPLGSLPQLFRPSAEAFSGAIAPYLQADTAQREMLRARYADNCKVVGVAWQTKAKLNGRKRSMDLSLWGELFAVPGVRWVNLQYGAFSDLERQVADAKAPILIDESVDQMADLDLFAAQVASMDLVITIDNSTAHLAGALGVPTWLMLPFACDWRWQIKGEYSLWYPSLRLFRQSEPAAWSPVIERISAQLRSYVKNSHGEFRAPSNCNVPL